MLLLNRRGFSNFMVCRACGERLNCVNCAVSLTFHRRDRRMLCHYCGYAEPVPENCPRCHSDHIQFLGSGSERVEDELHVSFPGARSPVSIAIASPQKALLNICCKASVRVKSTFWLEPR